MPDAALSDPIADRRRARAGLSAGVAAYLIWGVVAIYFDFLIRRGVSAELMLAYRITWSFVFLVALTSATRQWPQVFDVLRSWRAVRVLVVSTLLIAVNWYTYIYAVATHQLSQSSLGYYMNPLVNVLLGVAVLRERLRPMQTAAVIVAAAGVAYLTAASGRLPWIALLLAVSFGLYGLFRKTMRAGPVVGLMVETALCTPFTAAIIFYAHASANGRAPDFALPTHGLLALSGVITAIPLLLFAAAARRLRMTSLGFLQFLSPTIQLLIAVLWFGEPFSAPLQVAFAAIWVAITLFVVDQTRAARRRPEAPGDVAAATPTAVAPAVPAEV